MGTIQSPRATWAELPEISRHDRARFVKEARRLRAGAVRPAVRGRHPRTRMARPRRGQTGNAWPRTVHPRRLTEPRPRGPTTDMTRS